MDAVRGTVWPALPHPYQPPLLILTVLPLAGATTFHHLIIYHIRRSNFAGKTDNNERHSSSEACFIQQLPHVWQIPWVAFCILCIGSKDTRSPWVSISRWHHAHCRTMIVTPFHFSFLLYLLYSRVYIFSH